MSKLPPSSKYKACTTVKNFVLGSREFNSDASQYGFNNYTDPEMFVEGLYAMYDADKWQRLVDLALKHKPEHYEAVQKYFQR